VILFLTFKPVSLNPKAFTFMRILTYSSCVTLQLCARCDCNPMSSGGTRGSSTETIMWGGTDSRCDTSWQREIEV